MTKKQKKTLKRIIISAVLFIALYFVPITGLLKLVLYLIPYFIIGYDVLRKAILNIKNGQVFDENFLMAIATIGAMACGEYPEGVAVMLFYQIGELFQTIAVGKSRQSIASLMDVRPDYANIERDGKLEEVDPDEVAVGDIIVIRAGEKIPLDGIVREGSSAIDTAALTGESVPRDVMPGDTVISGCINVSGLLRVEVTKAFGESTVYKILEMVENSSEKKAKAENFITKFARYYTPAVVISAVLLAVIPSLITGDWKEWIQRALIFLVVSCPCALVISIPLSFFGGIGGASRCGILIKGSNYLEALAKTGVVVFDKTGTLTQGAFSVVKIAPEGRSEEEFLELAALAEHCSKHPLAYAVQNACKGDLALERVTKEEELPGRGVHAVIDGKNVYLGNARLMQEQGITAPSSDIIGTLLYMAVDGQYAGYLAAADLEKPEAKEALAKLKQAGVRKTVMLTGDIRKVGEDMAQRLGIDEVHTDLLPANKVEWVEKLLAEKSEKEQLVFVGDGINDAPVLMRADIGIAMGALGSDAAIEAADIVLMDDKLSKISQAIEIAKKNLRIVRQNVVFALGVKFLVLILGALGKANMWEAVFADVGVAVIAILNAVQMLRVGKDAK